MRKPINYPESVKALRVMRLHMKSCRECRTALKGTIPEGICAEGVILVLDAASKFTTIESLHKKALDNPGNVIYACPDRRKHGPGYLETATPYIAHEIQDRLF